MTVLTEVDKIKFCYFALLMYNNISASDSNLKPNNKAYCWLLRMAILRTLKLLIYPKTKPLILHIKLLADPNMSVPTAQVEVAEVAV